MTREHGPDLWTSQVAGPDDRRTLLLALPLHEDDPEDKEDGSEDPTEEPWSLIILCGRGDREMNLGSGTLLVLESDLVVAIILRIEFVEPIGSVVLDDILVPCPLITMNDPDPSVGIEIELKIGIALQECTVPPGCVIAVPWSEIISVILSIIAILCFQGNEKNQADESCGNEKRSKEAAHNQAPSLD